MELDLDQIASARARRHAASGGMDYLLGRVRCELARRWNMHAEQKHAANSSATNSRILLLDFADADWRMQLGDAEIERRSAFDAHDDSAADAPMRFDDAAFDGVIMCLQPAWLAWPALLVQAARALRPGGALLFCTFGPDTLAQVRWAWSQADELAHVHPFIDMHWIGDRLLDSNFVRPVMDVDRVAVEYADADALYADLRAEGFVNILSQRRKTLTGKHRFARATRALENLRAPGAPLAITYELIYGIAAAPPPSSLRVRVTPA